MSHVKLPLNQQNYRITEHRIIREPLYVCMGQRANNMFFNLYETVQEILTIIRQARLGPQCGDVLIAYTCTVGNRGISVDPRKYIFVTHTKSKPV